MNKELVFEFLDNLRESGITNMWSASPYVERVFDLPQKEARTLVLEWMDTFEKRHPITRS